MKYTEYNKLTTIKECVDVLKTADVSTINVSALFKLLNLVTDHLYDATHTESILDSYIHLMKATTDIDGVSMFDKLSRDTQTQLDNIQSICGNGSVVGIYSEDPTLKTYRVCVDRCETDEYE
jgi:hypothetical protein